MYNQVLNDMKPSASMKAGLSEQQKVMTNLAVGIPDLVAPREISDLVIQAAEAQRYNYVPSRGTKKALQNLKHLLFETEDALVPDRNLLLVSGAKYGIYLTLKTVCNAGDTVVLMQPYWLSYPEIVRSLGLNFVSWHPRVDAGGHLHFDFADFEALVKQHNVRALILNNPNNPSGKVFSKEFATQLAAMLERAGGWLLIDEVYRDLVFDSGSEKEFEVTGNNIVRVGSLSKSLSIPGLRLGYIAGPDKMIEYADIFNQHIQTCINSLSCYVMENLERDVFRSFAATCSHTYGARFALIASAFKGSDLTVLHSDATFYSLVNFGKHFADGQAACDFLAEKLDIIAVPGLPYGSDFKDYVRICLTLPTPTLAKVFDNILKHTPL
ncbi:MAG: pyridoxal phosphate-dependent aminotransferase [Taibaiella sp.]|nr:pyridoxal phosphate-dependent aminotransferase [Taibaiella sp.]